MSYYYTFINQSGKMVGCLIRPIHLALLSSKMQISPDKLNKLCMTDYKLLLIIAVTLIGRLLVYSG